jgi:AAA domain-containing protein
VRTLLPRRLTLDVGESVYIAGLEPTEPEPMVAGGLMHPKAITLIYGQGGIGKGMIALWVIRELRDEGLRPIVLDYESNDWEWNTRARGMGLRFPVRVPTEGVLTESAARAMAAYFYEEGVTHCIVDSATAAKSRAADNDFGAADSTIEFFRYLRILGVPVLLIGHEGKAQNKTPLGSVHFQTQSRIVYHAEAYGVGGIRLTCVKANDRNKSDLHFAFKIVREEGHFFDVDIDDFGMSKVPEAKKPTMPQALLEAMQATKVYSIDELVALIGYTGNRQSFYMMLGRMVTAKDVVRTTKGNYQKVST